MHEQTGEIKDYGEIPKEELGAWSEPFHVGEVVPFKGIQMEIIRIKKTRKELVLRHYAP